MNYLAILDVKKIIPKLPKIPRAFDQFTTKKGTNADKGILTRIPDKSKLPFGIGDKAGNKLMEYQTYLISDLIAIVEVGAIFYGFYHCIISMFTGNKSLNGNGAKPMDKVMLSYFVYFILRILNTAIKFRGGVIGK